ncbi:TPA: hypothetical protein ORP29_004313 [Escherichia coli]|uniref:hypothetical protein n=1 Tax=Escherichia coli TaxID=562 RepID=UPI0022F27C6B|nr:hypothetical protein [Escherichia coli]MDA5308905.1 hypothetical protein [Escherichia coli]HCS4536993.1 hypothetical protein [Escherichia coli]HCS4710504.1 hypothetical protein [Escherichia coli]
MTLVAPRWRIKVFDVASIFVSVAALCNGKPNSPHTTINIPQRFIPSPKQVKLSVKYKYIVIPVASEIFFYTDI